MANFIKNLFGKKITDEFSQVPEGVCPNCWGDQEYDNIIREKFQDKQIGVSNHDPTAKHAFIQEFIVTHLNGIHLKSAVRGLQCPKCKTIYEK